MGIQTLNIPIGDTYIKQGDTIPKITFTFDAGDPIDLTTVGTEIKMQILYRKEAFIDLAVGSGITIVSDKVFEIYEIDKADNTYPCGKHLGDLEITINGDRFTYFDVEYTIIEQYTT